MQQYDPSSLHTFFHRKILFRMSNSFFTGAQFGKSTVFVIVDSHSFFTDLANTNRWREFRLANKYYNIIDLSRYIGTFRPYFNRGSAITLLCSSRHYDFNHCILILHNGFNCGSQNRSIDVRTLPCKLTTRINPDPDWYLNINFCDHFEINDR